MGDVMTPPSPMCTSGNLFLVPLDAGSEPGAAMVQQLTDVAPKKTDPKLSDSQKFIRDEEEKLLEAVREQKDKKKKADDKEAKDKLPVLRSPGSPVGGGFDALAGRHPRLRPRRRAAGRRAQRRRAQLRERDRAIRKISRAGLPLATPRIARLLAVLNLKTGKTVWADGSFAPPVDEPVAAPARRPHNTESDPAAGPSAAAQASGRPRPRPRHRGLPAGGARDPVVDARCVE